MSYLLSTNALVGLSSPTPDMQRFASEVGVDAIHLSVISIGQLEAAIEALPVHDVSRITRARNLDTVVRQVDSVRGIYGVNLAVAQRWGQLQPLRLESATGTDLSVEMRLVVATALEHRFTLVMVTSEPWELTLKPLGLAVAHP